MCHHPKSTKAMLDKSDQERSHQEPDSVDSRTSNNGGVYSSSSSLRHTCDRWRLMCRDKIPETAALTDRIFSTHSRLATFRVHREEFRYIESHSFHRPGSRHSSRPHLQTGFCTREPFDSRLFPRACDALDSLEKDIVGRRQFLLRREVCGKRAIRSSHPRTVWNWPVMPLVASWLALVALFVQSV